MSPTPAEIIQDREKKNMPIQRPVRLERYLKSNKRQEKNAPMPWDRRGEAELRMKWPPY